MWGQDVMGALSPPRLFTAARRTGGFAARSLHHSIQPSRRKYPEVPVPAPTLLLVASVFAEELMLVALPAMDRLAKDDAELRRIGEDTERALVVMERNGWLDDPASYHVEPPAPDIFDLDPAEFRGLRYRRLSFESDYRPVDGLPGGERWLGMMANRRCYAHVLEHRGKPRPWLVFVHGFGMGAPFDLVFMRAAHYYRDLGFNVLAPVLPLHGPRRTGRGLNGDGLVSLDWVANVHGPTQAVWDVP